MLILLPPKLVIILIISEKSLFVSEIRYQKTFSSAQAINVSFKFHRNVPISVVAYALIITNEIKSVSGSGKRPFDRI